ncbi:uncharacterized protein HKW66_Vig0005020 [Vigna angularis]|uniref:Uncharacterized protein n=2 Tax=Phaseolus angularis TaxID=3914 RepID=A0A8T0LCT0_PHAAN|nr:uncharacterized protein HKW66_Vig0005020 [Vigna angularis]BAT74129.1 hypothetical protein VIGAN_01173100 [Vigna angularis var. angularis]
MANRDHHRCDKLFVTQESFNNYKDGSQDFCKASISAPRVVKSFNNKGSGSQNLRGLKIHCHDKSVLLHFRARVGSGISALFNYNGNGLQEFPGFSFFRYLRDLTRLG